MIKQGSSKTHLDKSGYKLKVAMQLKFKDTIVKRQVTLYLRSVVVVGRLKNPLWWRRRIIVVAERQKLHCDGDAKT